MVFGRILAHGQDLLKRGRKRAGELLEQTTDATIKAAQDVKTEVAKQGGIGAVAKKATKAAASGIGYGVGAARDYVHDLQTDTIGTTEHALSGAETGLKVGDFIVRNASTLADKVGKVTAAVKADAAQYVFSPEDRTVVIGSSSYVIGLPVVGGLHRQDVEVISAYMQEVSAKLPARLSDRNAVLQLIADKRISSNVELLRAAEKATYGDAVRKYVV